MNKNILVTGGRGFIGQHLVRALAKENKVYVIDNLSSVFCNKNSRDLPDNVVFIEGDVRDINKFSRLRFNFDVIYHLAAVARIQPSFKDPYGYIDNNVLSTVAVCEFAHRTNTKVIYAGSSSSQYGVHANPYAFSKWQAEEVCKMFSEAYGLNTLIARFFNVYGPGRPGGGEYSAVLDIFEHQLRTGQKLTVTGNGMQRRDFTHVNDIVSGLIAMNNEKEYKGDIYNLGRGKNVGIKYVALHFTDGENIEFLPARKGEAEASLADIEATKEEFGWEPTHNVIDYIKQIKEKLS